MSEKELEELKEANYKLKLNLESSRQSHMVEVEYLKEEIQVKENELMTVGDKLKAEFKQNLTNLQERLANITEDCQQSRDENNVLRGQTEQLQKTIEHLRSVQGERHSRIEQFETAKITVDQLNIELSSTRNLLEKQQSKVHQLTQLTEKQSAEISELREDLESKDQCISQLQSRMREIEAERQDAILQLQQAVMMQHKASEEIEDPSRRGNSLFSEVDKRRVRVEEELERLRQRVARLTAENVELQSTVERGDCRSALVLNQLHLIYKTNTELIHELKKLKSEGLQSLDTYRDRFEVLKKEYKRKLTQYRDGDSTPGVRELETLRDERDLLTSQKMSLERELWDMKKELKYAQQVRTETDAHFKILRIKHLQTQEQLEIMSKSEKPKIEANGTESSAASPSPSNSSGSKTAGGSSGGTGHRDNQNWLYNNIQNESERNLSAGASSSLRNTRNANFGTSSRSTSVSDSATTNGNSGTGQSEEEVIPDCNTQ